MTSIQWLGLALCLLAVAAAGLAAHGSRRWADATQALRRRLDTGRIDATGRPGSSARYDPRELEGLPAPVQRYFRAVLTEGQPLVTAVDVEHVGTFNLSATGAQWKAFTSQQKVTTRRPGFLWDARISMLPGVPVRVRDAYVSGEGILHAAVLGLFEVADLHGGGELARGELMRFFAEAAWYPTALLPSQGVHWEAVDDRSANATLVDGPLRLTLLFRFDESALITSVRCAARGRMVGKETVMVPWEGRWSDYQARDGMTVPLAGEAAWLLPEGRKPYWRGTIRSLVYEVSP